MYAYFGYLNFKKIKNQNENVDKSKKTMLEWIACTVILYLQSCIDWLIGWIPTYYFWKTLVVSFLMLESSVAVKLLYKFENYIVRFEFWMDEKMQYVYSTLSYISYPLLKCFLVTLKFTVRCCDEEQLQAMKLVIRDFNKEISQAKKENHRLLTKRKEKLREDVPPRPPKRSTPWLIKVSMAIKTTQRRPIFFPYTVWFETIKGTFSYQAEGDDKVQSDSLEEVSVFNESQLVLLLTLHKTKLLAKFTNSKDFQLWKNFLKAQCTH